VLRIQKCDVEVKYVQGKEIPLTDALSTTSPYSGDQIDGLEMSVSTSMPAQQGSTKLRRKQLGVKYS
jgi:hypothetical protein